MNFDPPLVAVIDTAAGYAYFGTDHNPARVMKVALGAGPDSPKILNGITLEPDEINLGCAVIDPIRGFAYFGTQTSPGRIIKIALGSGDNPPSRVGALTLESGEDQLTAAIIDPEAGYAYFGTGTLPVKIVTVALGDEKSLPVRKDALSLGDDELSVKCGLFDPTRGVGDFLTGAGNLMKFALGAGGQPLPLSSLTLSVSTCGVIDLENNTAYFCARGQLEFPLPPEPPIIPYKPGSVIKIALGEKSDAPTHTCIRNTSTSSRFRLDKTANCHPEWPVMMSIQALLPIARFLQSSIRMRVTATGARIPQGTSPYSTHHESFRS